MKDNVQKETGTTCQYLVNYNLKYGICNRISNNRKQNAVPLHAIKVCRESYRSFLLKLAAEEGGKDEGQGTRMV